MLVSRREHTGARGSASSDPAHSRPEASSDAGCDTRLIHVRALDHHFGEGNLRRKVLSGVNLDIHSGEIVILTGPSGSGKTTLLTLLGGLRSAQEGTLEVLGHDLVAAPADRLVAVRRRIGFIFQAHNLLHFLTARQNVRLSLELDGGLSDADADGRVAAMLETVGLADHMDKFPDQLSGGQKQRVAVARALVGRPLLVLADEPTAALDRKSGRDVVDLMQGLAKEHGSTVLLVTHDNRILDIADRIIAMEDGVIKE